MAQLGIAPIPIRAARPMPGRGLPDLPQFYYHSNVCEMLEFVQDRYEAILSDSHLAFIRDFYALPLAAQYAYCRLIGRKGHVFDTRKLAYPEIPNLAEQWEQLAEHGFTRALTVDDFGNYLDVITKPDVTALLCDVCPSLYKKSWKKADLIEVVKSNLKFKHCSIPAAVIAQDRTNALTFLLFLYFGKVEASLQAFTMRDLGLVKTGNFKVKSSARFETRSQAKAAFFYAKALVDFKTGSDADVARLIDAQMDWPEPECDHAHLAKDKLVQKLGGLSERLGDVTAALSLYALSDAPLCNEREVRLRYARDDNDDRLWVQARLEALIENPGSDDEYHFADDFYARKYKKKRTSAVTDILRRAETLDLDEAYRNAPERAAQRYYEAQGERVYRTENHLWRTLFGLMFWDELYGHESEGLYNGFERLPAGLKTGSFFVDNEACIREKLTRLKSSPRSLYVEILKTVAAHHRKGNGIFRWSGRTLDCVKALLEHAETHGQSAAIANMLEIMARDYQAAKDGFPDLMRLSENGVDFIEIKAEGDVIRRNQLTRLKQLRACGFSARINRVNWVVDPNQIYVVVDVETTGGRAATNRITEIGAVKMQGGKIISEFSTLLNPQRSIPSNITRLTGITNEMVASAPLFAEVAEDFATFMGDSIFAAHNVNFDYGFISEEYKRLEQSFRFPKICTCASMRKLYPGYKSYSLKNLCQNFDIYLTSHHRALCDAKAAAQLLILVNERRAELRV